VNGNQRTRILVEAGVLIALATVLSFLKVYRAPQGGSVTAASMVPIIMLALRWGPRAGILTGVAYGLVQQMIDPFVVHPVQMLLDYSVAFGLLGLAGLFRRMPALGASVGVLGRMVSHVVSGVVFFGAYAPEGSSVLAYSLVYNASYLVPEVIISAVVIQMLATSKVLTWGIQRARH